MATSTQTLQGGKIAENVLILGNDGLPFGEVGTPIYIQQADLNADIDDVSTFEGAISKRVDEASSTVTYIGEAAIGTSEISSLWRIRKIDFTNPISIKWAGTGVFDQVWTNRAALTYT